MLLLFISTISLSLVGAVGGLGGVGEFELLFGWSSFSSGDGVGVLGIIVLRFPFPLALVGGGGGVGVLVGTGGDGVLFAWWSFDVGVGGGVGGGGVGSGVLGVTLFLFPLPLDLLGIVDGVGRWVGRFMGGEGVGGIRLLLDWLLTITDDGDCLVCSSFDVECSEIVGVLVGGVEKFDSILSILAFILLLFLTTCSLAPGNVI